MRIESQGNNPPLEGQWNAYRKLPLASAASGSNASRAVGPALPRSSVPFRAPGRAFMSRLQRAVAVRVRTRWLQASWRIESLLGAAQCHQHRCDIADEAIADLSTEGVHVTSVERLIGPAAPIYRDAMARAVEFAAHARDAGNGVHGNWLPSGASIDLSADEMLRRLPELYLFGLSRQVLALAQRYLKVPVAYHGAVMRRSVVDGNRVGPRLWHRDVEDFHVLRTIVYLTDVDEDSGPFEYIPRHRKIDPRDLRDLRSGAMRTNEAMQEIVPMTEWRQCLGPAGTVVLADTAQVLHHESLQRGRERCVVMMGHSSRRPSGRALALSHFRAEAHVGALGGLLLPEHRPHVFGWRGSRF